MNKNKDLHQVFLEKKRISQLSLIREIVFGAQDGLLVPLGVVSSIAGAFSNNHIVIVAGIAEALAGAFSMGTGAYLASQAEHQVHQFEIKKELAEIKADIEGEKAELRMLLHKDGLPEKEAKVVVEALAKSQRAFSNTVIQKELGLDPNSHDSPLKDAFYIGISYLIAAFIPILPYFFWDVSVSVVISIVLTLISLFTIGLIKAYFAKLNFIKSGFQVLLIGALSGIGGYVIGVYLPHFLGIK